MTRYEWAVRWPQGEIEECPTLERAQEVMRLYSEPVLLRRTVVVGEWEPDTSLPEHACCWHGQGHPDLSDPACCRCEGSPCGHAPLPAANDDSPADGAA